MRKRWLSVRASSQSTNASTGEPPRLSPDGGRGNKRTYELPRAGALREELGPDPPPRSDHEVRLPARQTAAGRGRLALPPPAAAWHQTQGPPNGPARCGDRDRLESSAAAASALARARHPAPQTQTDRRGRHRPARPRRQLRHRRSIVSRRELVYGRILRVLVLRTRRKQSNDCGRWHRVSPSRLLEPSPTIATTFGGARPGKLDHRVHVAPDAHNISPPAGGVQIKDLSRPWSTITTTTPSPLGTGLPTSISQSRPSSRQSNLRTCRDFARQPIEISERSHNAS